MDFINIELIDFVKEIGIIITGLIAFLLAKRKLNKESNEINQKIDYEIKRLSLDAEKDFKRFLEDQDIRNKQESASLRNEFQLIISAQNNTIAELNRQISFIQKDLEACHSERAKLMILLERSSYNKNHQND